MATVVVNDPYRADGVELEVQGFGALKNREVYTVSDEEVSQWEASTQATWPETGQLVIGYPLETPLHSGPTEPAPLPVVPDEEEDPGEATPITTVESSGTTLEPPTTVDTGDQKPDADTSPEDQGGVQ